MSEFWLGIFLSIPIGIATSLVTPAIQRAMEQRSTEKSAKQLKRTAEEERLAVHFRINKDDFTQYMVYIGLRIAYISAVTAVLSGLLYGIGQITLPVRGAIGLPYNLVEIVQGASFFVAQMILLVGSLMIMNLCRLSLSTWRRVHGGETWVSSDLEVAEHARGRKALRNPRP